MKKFWFVCLFSIGISVWLLSPYLWQAASRSHPNIVRSNGYNASQISSLIDSQKDSRSHSLTGSIEYSTQELPKSVVHILKVPREREFEVIPVVSESLQPVREFIQQTQGVAALNAGFFDPINQKTTSYIVQAGKLVADPRSNERLMENPNLQSYLDRILNRSELRRYRCNTAMQYDITLHRDPVPVGCELVDSIGAGPQLLPESTGELEGFLATVNGAIVRDALGSRQPNARSAVGMTADGTLLLVMAAQKQAIGTPAGVTLSEMADLLQALGATKAMNLDGGSSSSMFYAGQIFLGQYNRQGERVERPVKSVLLVRRKTP